MKKIFFTLIACFSVTMLSFAQDQTGLFSVAGNLSYGTKIESLGVGVRAQYGFTERIRGVAEYKYYVDRHNLSEWEFTTDAHYVFSASDLVSLYPIGGVTFSRWTYDPNRVKLNGPGLDKDLYKKSSNNRLGLNIGFGGQIAVGENIFVQLELKEHVTTDYSQFVISAGFMYQF